MHPSHKGYNPRTKRRGKPSTLKATITRRYHQRTKAPPLANSIGPAFPSIITKLPSSYIIDKYANHHGGGNQSQAKSSHNEVKPHVTRSIDWSGRPKPYQTLAFFPSSVLHSAQFAGNSLRKNALPISTSAASSMVSQPPVRVISPFKLESDDDSDIVMPASLPDELDEAIRMGQLELDRFKAHRIAQMAADVQRKVSQESRRPNLPLSRNIAAPQTRSTSVSTLQSTPARRILVLPNNSMGAPASRSFHNNPQSSTPPNQIQTLSSKPTNDDQPTSSNSDSMMGNTNSNISRPSVSSSSSTMTHKNTHSRSQSDIDVDDPNNPIANMKSQNPASWYKLPPAAAYSSVTYGGSDKKALHLMSEEEIKKIFPNTPHSQRQRLKELHDLKMRLKSEPKMPDQSAIPVFSSSGNLPSSEGQPPIGYMLQSDPDDELSSAVVINNAKSSYSGLKTPFQSADSPPPHFRLDNLHDIAKRTAEENLTNEYDDGIASWTKRMSKAVASFKEDQYDSGKRVSSPPQQENASNWATDADLFHNSKNFFNSLVGNFERKAAQSSAENDQTLFGEKAGYEPNQSHPLPLRNHRFYDDVDDFKENSDSSAKSAAKHKPHVDFEQLTKELTFYSPTDVNYFEEVQPIASDKHNPSTVSSETPQSRQNKSSSNK